MGQTSKVGSHKTTISTDNGMTAVTYHHTKVIQWDATKIILNSGGWLTATTKTRINQAATQFGLPIHVYQKNHKWFVTNLEADSNQPFTDGMVIERLT